MTSIDLTPLYRNTIGFDRLASLLEGAYQSENSRSSYPPYDIEMLDENRYHITLAVAGLNQEDIDIQVERNVMTIKGHKAEDTADRKYLYRGIATRAFERKFNLADHVEIVGAKLTNGLLTIDLKREIPEAMKPRKVEIETDSRTAIEHQESTHQAA